MVSGRARSEWRVEILHAVSRLHCELEKSLVSDCLCGVFYSVLCTYSV